MKQYDTIIFDLDGTISDSKEGITKCVQYALLKLGIRENDLNSLEHFIGPPLITEFMKTYGFTKEQAHLGVAYYRERYEPIGIYETCIYPDIQELLKALKENGKIVAMATSKPQLMAEEVIRHFKIEQYFDCIVGAERNGPRQTKTDVLLELFNKINVDEYNKDKVVLIGDTYYDVEGAANAEIDCIAVCYGYGKKNELLQAGAICTVESAKELIRLLTKQSDIKPF